MTYCEAVLNVNVSSDARDPLLVLKHVIQEGNTRQGDALEATVVVEVAAFDNLKLDPLLVI